MEKEITANYLRQYIHTSGRQNTAQSEPRDHTQHSDAQDSTAQKYTFGRSLYKDIDTSAKDKVITTAVTDVQKGDNYRISRVNIDSRYRNVETKNILDDKITYLGDNPLTITSGSNVVRVTHPNHEYTKEDKIVMQGVQGDFVNLRNGLTLLKDSNFIRINHNNHQQYSSLDTDNLYIIISGVIGNKIKSTSLQNIPINEINKKHKIYFKRVVSDIPNNNFYYINIDTFADSDLDYNLSDINIYFLQLGGIPVNELNANYPVSTNQINGYHIVSNIIDKNTYEIISSTPCNITQNSKSVGGNKCWVARVVDFIEGYPSNNYYKISLKKTFYNVKKIRLISTEFPNTERVIKSYPENKRNNMLYWQISNDGNEVYSIEVTPGNYTVMTLKEELESKIRQIERPTLVFLNNNIVNQNYYYDTYIIPSVDIKSETDTFTLKLYEKVIVQKPFTLINTIESDGFRRMRVFHPNHKLVNGDIITIDNASSTENVPADILNITHTIEKVLDKDNYQIKLSRYNELESDVTNGGNAVNITYLLKFRLLFDRPGTIGRVFGFSDVGKSSSVTGFNKGITNNTLYENSVTLTTEQNIINLSGDNYILMSSPLFKESYSSGQIDGVFAKLLLASDPGTVMFNQFVQLGEGFSVPINSLSEFEVSFFDPSGDLFYFNNIDHSYTLEIYEDVSQE